MVNYFAGPVCDGTSCITLLVAWYLPIVAPAILAAVAGIILWKKKKTLSKIVLLMGVIYIIGLISYGHVEKYLFNREFARNFKTTLFMPEFPKGYRMDSPLLFDYTHEGKGQTIQIRGLTPKNVPVEYEVSDSSQSHVANVYRACLHKELACEKRSEMNNFYIMRFDSSIYLRVEKTGSFVQLYAQKYDSNLEAELIKIIQSIKPVDSI